MKKFIVIAVFLYCGFAPIQGKEKGGLSGKINPYFTRGYQQGKNHCTTLKAQEGYYIYDTLYNGVMTPELRHSQEQSDLFEHGFNRGVLDSCSSKFKRDLKTNPAQREVAARQIVKKYMRALQEAQNFYYKTAYECFWVTTPQDDENCIGYDNGLSHGRQTCEELKVNSYGKVADIAHYIYSSEDVLEVLNPYKFGFNVGFAQKCKSSGGAKNSSEDRYYSEHILLLE